MKTFTNYFSQAGLALAVYATRPLRVKPICLGATLCRLLQYAQRIGSDVADGVWWAPGRA